MESAAALSCRTFAFRCIFTPPCHSATSSQRLNKTRTSFSSMPALRRNPFRSSGEVHEKKATKQNAASPQTHKSSFLHVFIFHAHLVRRVLSEQLFQHHDTEGSVVRQCFWSSNRLRVWPQVVRESPSRSAQGKPVGLRKNAMGDLGPNHPLPHGIWYPPRFGLDWQVPQGSRSTAEIPVPISLTSAGDGDGG